jgi:hypothetical protein
MNIRTSLAAIFLTLAISTSPSFADEIAASALAAMPVREVTVFKDGHAFVLHEGDVAPDAEGNVQLNYLPTPVIGTFWPYCADPKASLVAASAGRTKISVERPALQIRELLEANIGAQVLIHEADKTYLSTVVDVPAREPREDQLVPAEASMVPPRELGQVILLKTENGTKVINVDMIRDVTFTDEPRRKLTDYEYRNLLKLRLDWKGQQPAQQVHVGMTYLQKGIRWIPEYRITLNEDGQAQVELQATLLNELADLNDVKAHLVVGVPTFTFKETIDPIALTQAVAQLSSYFQQPNQTGYAFSNSIMLQTQSRMAEVRAPQQPVDTGPELPGSDSTEDLFIFTLDHVSLKRGERMVVSIGSWTVSYEDRFSLHIPYAPPPEVRNNVDTQQQAELARLLHSPKVQHKVRLTNSLQVPFTTAPALLLSKDRILGQGMMTYAAPGGISDITVTTAVNVAVTHQETEKQRTQNAMTWNTYSFDRLDMNGVIRLTSFLNEPVHVEVVREALGEIDSADNDAKIERLGPYGNIDDPSPAWSAMYNWPVWWRHVAGVGRAKWELTLKPRETVELKYDWHYFWVW